MGGSLREGSSQQARGELHSNDGKPGKERSPGQTRVRIRLGFSCADPLMPLPCAVNGSGTRCERGLAISRLQLPRKAEATEALTERSTAPQPEVTTLMDTDCNSRLSVADAMKLDWLHTAHKAAMWACWVGVQLASFRRHAGFTFKSAGTLGANFS